MAFIQDNPSEPAPELSETLIQYTTIIVLKFLTRIPNHFTPKLKKILGRP